jgi:hypothetical protein
MFDDINTIRAWLGHVSLATTNVYSLGSRISPIILMIVFRRCSAGCLDLGWEESWL